MRPKGEQTRILVIEDDPDLRFIPKETLKKTGYEVQAVESDFEGLEAMNHSNCHPMMRGCPIRETNI